MTTCIIVAFFCLTNPFAARIDGGAKKALSDSIGKELPTVFVNSQALRDQMEDRGGNMQRWYTSVEWANWALVLVGVAGVAFAIKTMKAVRQQGDAMVTSERAWLIIGPGPAAFVPEPESSPAFRWFVKNVGNTPAELIETQSRCWKRAEWERLPETPDYGDPIELHHRILAPGDSMGFNTFFSEWNEQTGEFQVVSSLNPPERLYFVAFGYVKYRSFGRICTSRFLDDCARSAGDLTPMTFRPKLGDGALAVYTKHT